MEIQEAITQARKRIENRKKQQEIQKEKWEKIKEEQQKKDILLRERKKKLKKELLKECCEKVNEFLRDKNNIEGITFLEEKGRHFTLEQGRKHAIYLCSDGSFKEQHWGMYMGDKNIQRVGIGSLAIETVERILQLNLKELVIEQILELGKPKQHKPDKITQDTFNEVFG